jgi:hypothetical protein
LIDSDCQLKQSLKIDQETNNRTTIKDFSDLEFPNPQLQPHKSKVRLLLIDGLIFYSQTIAQEERKKSFRQSTVSLSTDP